MIEIIQGERQPFTIDVNSILPGNKKKPFNFTGFVDIHVCFVLGDADAIVKKESDGDVSIVGLDNEGVLTGFLEIADTVGMAPGKGGTVEILVDFGGAPQDVKKSQIINAFIVIESKCPPVP